MNSVLRPPCEEGISDLTKCSDIPSGVLGRGQFGHLHNAVKRAVAEDLRASKWSREQVAERLTWLVGKTVTLAQVDAIAAETKENRLPAEWVPAWIVATGSQRVLALLCDEAGGWLASERDRKLAELGAEGLRAKKASARIAELESQLWDNKL